MMLRAVREPASPWARLRHGRRLIMADREEIAHLKRERLTVSEIASVIGFDKSTASRELRRNVTDGRYRATRLSARPTSGRVWRRSSRQARCQHPATRGGKRAAVKAESVTARAPS
ncbi:helix-turn-helix domain-containing protein [Nocardioides sp. MH1]|uniref:helix-turn-helix domain-containing protein n=1 Tax=Nocardioides sp. MH1 TaxID=3242490 RepID=UPI003520BC10